MTDYMTECFFVFSFRHSRARGVQCNEGAIYAYRRWISHSLLGHRSPIVRQCKKFLHPTVASKRSASASKLFIGFGNCCL